MVKRVLEKVVHSVVKKMQQHRSFNLLLKVLTRSMTAECIAYGQNYEDGIIEKLIESEISSNGFYVDVGAHHPVRFSNTYRLYLSGWNGINIDPLPHVMEIFEEYRPDDINLNVGIAVEKGQLEYYSFEEPAYNTINSERAAEVLRNKYSKLKEKIVVQVDTLKNVLDKHLNGQEIDLLTLDVEKLELEVLKSNDWEKYRPRIIVMESLAATNHSLDRIYEDPAVQYLIDNEYIAVAKVANAVFFRRV